MGKDSDIFCGRKQAGMSGYSAHDAGVFILHFALDNSSAEFTGGGLHRRIRRVADRGARATFVDCWGEFVFSRFSWGLRFKRHCGPTQKFSPTELLERVVR